LGLYVASKPDSQEICFVNDNDYGKFIEENTDKEIKPGYFVDTKGNILGKHRGIIHYTVGQRKKHENEVYSKELTAYDKLHFNRQA